MKAIISAGGTGGHIYPALAIINKIKSMEPSSEILYIGTTDRMESTLIPEKNIPYVGLEMEGINRKNILKNISVLKKYFSAIKKAQKEIKKFNPDVVIGVGGYVTAPVIKAAKKLKYKAIIHEQNSIPGVSNEALSKIADKILVSLPDTVKYFPKEKTVYTGNPRSEEITTIKKATKKEFGLSENKKLVVIVMGSLGSATINKKELSLIKEFTNKSYEVLLITGEKYFADYQEINIPSNVKVKPFLNNLINLLKISDLIVSRAGASTIAEITAIGLPAILVPSPYVTNNHQLKNAKELEKNGACLILEEKDFNKENLINLIDKVLTNQKLYQEMKTASKKLGVTDSATRVYNEIKKLVEVDSKWNSLFKKSQKIILVR